MPDITKEIEQLAKSMEAAANPKENTSAIEDLPSIQDIILNLGKEGLQKAVEVLSDEEKVLLKQELENIKKATEPLCKTCGKMHKAGECPAAPQKLEKKQGVPKGADLATHERCVKKVKAKGHDKSSAYAICNAVGAGMKKSEILEAVVERLYEKTGEIDPDKLSDLAKAMKLFPEAPKAPKIKEIEYKPSQEELAYTLAHYLKKLAKIRQYSYEVSNAFDGQELEDVKKATQKAYDLCKKEVAETAQKLLSTKRSMKKAMKVDPKEMVEEHKRLVEVLESPSHEDDKKEAKKQKKELEEYKNKMKKSEGELLNEESLEKAHEHIKEIHKFMKENPMKKSQSIENLCKSDQEFLTDVNYYILEKSLPSEDNLDFDLQKAYIGFKKLVEKLRAQGAKNPEAVAASIGRKKYGEKRYNQMIAAGKPGGKKGKPAPGKMKKSEDSKFLVKSFSDEDMDELFEEQDYMKKALSMEPEASSSEEGDDKKNKKKRRFTAEDDTLVKPAAASIDHQGDHSPEGIESPIIKSQPPLKDVIVRMQERNLEKAKCIEALAKSTGADEQKLSFIWDRLEEISNFKLEKSEDLLQVGRGGQNYHTSVDEYIVKNYIDEVQTIIKNQGFTWEESSFSNKEKK